MVLPTTVNTWPPLSLALSSPVLAANALPAPMTTLPEPLLITFGAVTSPTPSVINNTPWLLFWVISKSVPLIPPTLPALPIPAVNSTAPAVAA